MRYCLFLLGLLLSNVVFGQGSTAPSPPPKTFVYVQQMPQSTVDINDYISQHLVYPDDAKAANAEGRVILHFIVDTAGKLRDIKVVRSVFPSIDSEAVHLLANMPAWKPGKQDGKVVSVFFTLPISFRL